MDILLQGEHMFIEPTTRPWPMDILLQGNVFWAHNTSLSYRHSVMGTVC